MTNPRKLRVAALPTASESYRGVIVVLVGSSGNQDVPYVCVKLGVAGDATYDWQQLPAP